MRRPMPIRGARLPWRGLCAIALVLMTGPAPQARAAGRANPKPSAAAPSRTTVRFNDDTIDGTLLRPEGDLMSGRPDIPMPSLVQPPRSFDRAEQRTILAAAAALEGGADGRASRNRKISGHTDGERAVEAGEGSDVGGGARPSGSTR